MSACGRILSYTVRNLSLLLLYSLKQPHTGVPYDEVIEDPRLGGRRTQLVIAAAKKLAECRMIAYDAYSGALTITDLGRIAAKYYIRHASIEIFNKEFRVRMTEADVLTMLAKSTEVSMTVTEI
jgi:antiviral helicase SLH1